MGESARAHDEGAQESVRGPDGSGHGADRVPSSSPVGGFRPSAALDVGTVLDLQRAAGNAVVARLVTGTHGPAPRPPLASGYTAAWPLARFEAGEHAQFAGEETIDVNGVPIPKGNIIAMGDFYRDPDAMQSAPPEELRRLNELIERDKKARMKVPGFEGTEPTNKDFEDATTGRAEGEGYMDLNKANEGHFAPPKDPKAAAESAREGKDHKSLWERHHRKALDDAKEANSGDVGKSGDPADAGTSLPGGVPASSGSGSAPARDPKVPEHAKATNMFAAHFLTDAFSSGHLVNKGEVMDRAEKGWGKMKNEGWWITLSKENSFTKTVAQRVLADGKVRSKLENMQLKVVVWGDVTSERFSQLLYLMSSFKGETFFNLFARIVHDVLNEEGVEVKNNKGRTWKAFGDEKLNAESLEIGKEAVAESEKNLEEAAKTVGQLDYQAMFQRVWDYVPQPTEKGQEFIDKVTKQFTDANDPATVDRVVALSIKEIEIAIGELKKEGRLRPKPDPEAARKATSELPIGMGRPVPWEPKY